MTLMKLRLFSIALAAITLVLLFSTIAGANAAVGDAPATITTSGMPAGFVDTPASVPFSGNAVSFRFAADGTLFVGLKEGRIVSMNGVGDTSPRQFIDISAEIDDSIDQGLLGLAVHPDWNNKPYVYGLYTVANGATHGGQLTRWTYNATSGLPVPGSRVDLITSGWCFVASGSPYGSHSIGDLRFGPDEMLYIGAGEGANFDAADVGDFAADQCPDGLGAGGALRAQNMTSLDGSILRVDPDTGLAAAGNPYFTDPDVNKARIIAKGLRNPFRFAIDQQSGELWIPDNGWSSWEEINRIADPTDAVVENFGWPCYEGIGRQPDYENQNNAVCQALYNANSVTAPVIALKHNTPDWAFSSTGAIIYTGNAFPAQYSGALFFADLAAGEFGPSDEDPDNTIRVMLRDQNNKLDPSTQQPFVQNGTVKPVDLQVGPDGALYYMDYDYPPRIHKISYAGALTPTAVIQASATAGQVPLTVDFNGSSSVDPIGSALTYAWDIDNDGQFDDAVGPTTTFTFTTLGINTVRLRVTNVQNASNIATVAITLSSNQLVNLPPVVTITAPSTNFTYAVGDAINFAGTAYDPDGLAIPSSRMDWSVILNHCQPYDATNCHPHGLATTTGLNGSVVGPDHENPSSVAIRLSVTEQPWWSSQWQYRKLLLLDTTQITEPLVNFPVLVTLTPQTFEYAKVRADGGDIRFIDENNNVLSYEIDSWNPAGTSTIWVKFPTVTPGARAGAWVYYGNAAATMAETPAAVWSQDYVAVYHMSAATGSAVDATGAHNGVFSGGPTQTTGPRGPALLFDGIDDEIDTGRTADLGADSWSISLWAQLDPTVICIDGPADDVEGRNLIVKDYDYRIYLKESCQLGFITQRLPGDPENAKWPISETEIFEVGPMNDTQWHSITYQYRKSANTVDAYFDGVLVGSNASQTSMRVNGASFKIGGEYGLNFPGGIDEVAFSSKARSASWIAAQHQVFTGSFTSFGTEQAEYQVTPATTSQIVIVYPKTVTLTLDSTPSGMNVTTYGRELVTPSSQQVTIGALVTFTAPATQMLNSISYVFANWSNGGQRNQNILIGTEDVSFTAEFIPAAVQLPIRTTPGGVTVYMGAANTTPIGVTNASGALDLSLQLSGVTDGFIFRFERALYQTEYVPFQASASSPNLLTVTMKPNGTVNLTGMPEDSTVFVNDVEQPGTAPMMLYLLPGNYTIRIEKSGYRANEQTVSVAANSAQAADIQLVRIASRGGGGGGGGGGGSSTYRPPVSRLNATNNSTNRTTTVSSTPTTPTVTPAVCVSAWTCTEWTVCTDGAQTRSCTDSMNCARPTDRPLEVQTCTVQQTDAPLITGEVTGETTEGTARGPAWLLVASIILIAGAIGAFLYGRTR